MPTTDTLASTAGRRRRGRSGGSAGPTRRVAAFVVGGCLALAACGGGSSSSSSPPSSAVDPPPSTDAAAAAAWEGIDERLSALGPEVSFLAARVDADGMCASIHAVEPSTPRPMASQFKLFVLGALATQVAAGALSWDQTVTVDEADRSFGNGEGSLQEAEPGASVSIEDAATRMISISDNTATDILIDLVGRDVVEAQADRWMADASANVPFLTTRQVFLLHYVPDLAEQYLSLPQGERAAFLTSSVDPLPLSDMFPGLTPEPRHVDEIEWFGSAEDVCRAFAGLQDLSTAPELAPLSAVLSREVAGIGLDRSDWPTVWYKGGSEPGVLTLGWLASDRDGQRYVVEAMVADTEAALRPDAITDLVALAADAFALLE